MKRCAFVFLAALGMLAVGVGSTPRASADEAPKPFVCNKAADVEDFSAAGWEGDTSVAMGVMHFGEITLPVTFQTFTKDAQQMVFFTYPRIFVRHKLTINDKVVTDNKIVINLTFQVGCKTNLTLDKAIAYLQGLSSQEVEEFFHQPLTPFSVSNS